MTNHIDHHPQQLQAQQAQQKQQQAQAEGQQEIRAIMPRHAEQAPDQLARRVIAARRVDRRLRRGFQTSNTLNVTPGATSTHLASPVLRRAHPTFQASAKGTFH